MAEGLVGAAACGLPEAIESPGLGAGPVLGAAYELKFQLTPAEAHAIEAWARQHLTPDPHGQHGTYRITSVYCDTPRLDVFHRTEGYRRSKFRVRRYGTAERVFLERKSKKAGRVKKKRVEVHAAELPVLVGGEAPPEWVGAWFLQRVRRRSLLPTCCVAYHRTAFLGRAGGSPVRLTLDRDLVGMPVSAWDVPPLTVGRALLTDAVLLELKYHVAMPALFHDLLPRLPLQSARGSKYRRCIQLCGLGVSQANGSGH
jgi:hypothetical protein